MRFKFVLLMSLITASLTMQISAAPIQRALGELKLNAEMVNASDKSKPFFLILHGTFAWHGMELPTALQELLKEEGYGSLAFTLSLGESDRKGFYNCEHTIVSKHEDAQNEIAFWQNYLNELGYKNIVLLGHSRGGVQMAQYALDNPSKVNKAYLIAPMTWNEQQEYKNYNKGSKQTIQVLIGSVKNGEVSTIENQNILHCKNAKVSAESLLSYYGENPVKDTPSLLNKIGVQTTIYLGDQDHHITDSFNENRSKFAKNSLVSVKLIEDADHFFRDFAAEDIVTDIIESL